ncbi:unnamed protein product [Strongylus vulgaris]|uniref:FAD-binding PCMH-type domain-containing protein n=1 Tax=Strongylus vulgaris TaxID=40348 RepID=A0A3P7J049_STRVU|nr:unnamed protein product [Strongylus vulgaris]
MPLSTIYDMILSTRNKLIYSLGTAPRAHARKVAAIQRQMREWAASGHGTKVLPVHSGWFDIFRQTPNKGITPISVGVLQDILEMREWAASGHGTKVLPVHSGWFNSSRQTPSKGTTPISVGVLQDILEIDMDRLNIRVEPMVTMSQLSQVLLPLGYSLPILPGWPGLTVQGKTIA